MKRFFKKHWPLVGIILLFVVAAVYIFGTPESDDDAAGFTDILLEKGVNMMENISLTGGDPNKGLKWFLKAKKGKTSINETSYSGTDFRVKLEFEDGTWIELKGEEGDYDRDSGEFTLRGNVNGQTKDGYRFVTDHIFYREEKGSIETDAPVEIFGPSFSVSGQGLDFNLEKGDLRILADVTTHIYQNRQEL
jgi:LPS export ABC transporter protein LptC